MLMVPCSLLLQIHWCIKHRRFQEYRPPLLHMLSCPSWTTCMLCKKNSALCVESHMASVGLLRNHGGHSLGKMFSLSIVEAEDGWSRFSLSKTSQLIQQYSGCFHVTFKWLILMHLAQWESLPVKIHRAGSTCTHFKQDVFSLSLSLKLKIFSTLLYG